MSNKLQWIMGLAIAFALVCLGIFILVKTSEYRIAIVSIKQMYIVEESTERSSHDIQGNHPNVKHLKGSQAYRD